MREVVLSQTVEVRGFSEGMGRVLSGNSYENGWLAEGALNANPHNGEHSGYSGYS
jgi:hypothetical protein